MPSKIYESMREYQRKGAHFARRNRNVLIADQPGLGKTMQALGTILALAAQEGPKMVGPDHRVAPRKHLVVCPKVAVTNVWEPEIRRWLSDQKVEVLPLVGPVKDRDAAMRAFRPAPGTEHVFVLTNIESLRITPVPDDLPKTRKNVFRFTAAYKGEMTKMVYAPENGVIPPLWEHTWDTVICDESHRALIAAKVSKPTQTRAGFTLLRSRRRIALSGTPMRGKPEQLWGTLNWLRPDEYRSYWNWVKTYFNLTSDGFSNYVLAGFKTDGEERLARDLQRVMLRRTKAEVVPELPAKTYAGAYIIPGDEESPLGVWLDMHPEQRKQYDRLMTEATVEDVMVNGSLALYTRQRQLAGAVHTVENGQLTPTLKSPKFEWLAEWLAENEDEKVVVVSQFTSVIDAFAKGLKDLGHGVTTLTGKTSDKTRERIVREFQSEGGPRVFMLNTKAGGVALTLDAADYVIFLDETSIPDDQEQAEDRVHRVSRMHNVTIYYLRCLDTIEEEVAYIAAARQDVQTYLLDGARGVEFAKKVYLDYRGKKEEKTA